jgi:hypothetical protein
VERGRKKPAPSVDLISHLPTLPLPLQGGDFGPVVSARGSVFFHNKARRLPLSLSPRKGRTRGVERPQHQASISFPIYPPCPSLSREGTSARPSRQGRASVQQTKHVAYPRVFPLKRDRKKREPGEGADSIPSFCLSLRRQGSFSLWRRDSGGGRSSETTQSSDRAPCPSRPGAGQGRPPRRVPPGGANAGGECRLVQLFPSPLMAAKERTPRRVMSVGSLHRGTSSCTSFSGSV